MGTAPAQGTAGPSPARGMSLVAATSLGVGGMMGAGLYTLLGLASVSTGSYLPLAFVLAAGAAVFSVYSYAHLGAHFPSGGGSAHFIDVEFGDSLLAGGLNVFQYLAYLVATALYAAGFAEYATALGGSALPSWSRQVFAVGVVLVFLLVNWLGSNLVGRAETAIVGVEVVILLGFIVLGLLHADPARLLDGGGEGAVGVVTGAALLYVTYQGFGVVTNASDRMGNPRRELPRAMFTALGVVAALYVVISTIVVAVVPLPDVLADAGHVLADAGEAVAGRAGFVVIAAAALLATGSAVNATLFASSSIGLDEARTRQLPRAMRRPLGADGNVALVTSAVLVIALVLFFPLSAVGQMTSLAFLVVYGAVSLGHLKVRGTTGARAWPLVTAVVVNALLFVALLVEAIGHGSPSTWVTLLVLLVGSFVAEAVVRRRRGGPGGGAQPKVRRS